MLQEIMRRGTNSLGTDVPSETEINRLAARTEEEFWLFEKVDEERRQKERYKSRLMEEKEVPDWVYHKTNQEKTKESIGMDTRSGEVTGKRRRKEVIYADLLSDVQWMKAVEDGEDLSKLSSAGKRSMFLFGTYESGEQPSDPYESDEVVGQNMPKEKNMDSMVYVGVSDDSSKKPVKYQSGILLDNKDEEGDASSWQDKIITWRSHKRKRSSHGLSSSASDIQG
ncbi:hypothetical protein B296_00047125 [Ensete ventricosum]|uniref:Snf2 ATP coupling domain-containing protein n=1 Tax=Ensete ventricosum TaxID=4639 RepID=A0A426YRN8_ENSVE|nr:hypothetical protein B296_00047125 [Ensete ventricosum]